MNRQKLTLTTYTYKTLHNLKNNVRRLNGEGMGLCEPRCCRLDFSVLLQAVPPPPAPFPPIPHPHPLVSLTVMDSVSSPWDETKHRVHVCGMRTRAR